MKLIQKLSPSMLAIAALSIAAAVPVVAHADGLASARLEITNFQFIYNTSELTVTAAPSLGNTSAATFNNLVATPVLGPLQSTSTVGPQAGLFNQNSQNLALGIVGNYAGGFANQTGSGLVGGGGASALTAATVSLDPQGNPFNSSSGSNTVTQQFDISVIAPNTTANVGLTFNADLFLRSYLNAEGGVFLGGSSTAFTNWRLEVFRIGDGTVLKPTFRIMEWTPSFSGPAFTQACNMAFITNCAQAASFDLGQSVNAFSSVENTIIDTGSGNFSLGVTLLGGERYRFGVTHISNANANLMIPEPGSLALIGLALFGAAVATRRRNV